MSHTKGQWVSRDSAIGVVSDADDQSFGMMLAVAYVEQYDRPEEWVDNSKRIVDCVNACDGMENPVDEIAKLRYEIAMLYRLIDDKDSEIARMAIIAAKAENNLADALDEIDELRASSAGWK